MKMHALNKRLVTVLMGLSALAVAAGVGLYGCQAGDEPSTEGELGSAAEMPKDEEITYTCPMHPEVVSNEPGECPTCGMDLVPADEVAKGDSVGAGETQGD